MTFLAKYPFALLVTVLLLAITSIASDVDAFENHVVHDAAVHGLDHLPDLAARLLTRDPREYITSTVTVTETECGKTEAPTSQPSETASVPAPIKPGTLPPTAPGTETAPGTVPAAGTLPPCLSSTVGETTAPTSGVHTTLTTTVVFKPPITSLTETGLTTLPVQVSISSTHKVNTNETLAPTHSCTKCTNSGTPITTATPSASATALPNMAADHRKDSLGQLIAVGMSIVFLLEAL